MKWSVEDYGTAVTLRNLSPKTCRYLKTKLNYPLPDLSTLRKWAVKQLSLEVGVLHDVLKLMKARATNMSELDRVTVLAFDEMYLNEEVSFDSREEQIIGPHKAVQVVFARGLFARWKQPVYYKYDQTMTKEILTDIICQLEGSGFQVVATVSDLGGSNRKLWRDLKISTKLNCSFPNPNDSTREIFVFSDAPHLLKLHRNHFLDHGFNLNGLNISSEPIHELLRASSSSDTKLAYKLTPLHLSVRGTQRQKEFGSTIIFQQSCKGFEMVC